MRLLAVLVHKAGDEFRIKLDDIDAVVKGKTLETSIDHATNEVVVKLVDQGVKCVRCDRPERDHLPQGGGCRFEGGE